MKTSCMQFRDQAPRQSCLCDHHLGLAISQPITQDMSNLILEGGGEGVVGTVELTEVSKGRSA